MSELPKGWSHCELRDVGEIITGNTPSKSNSANYGDKYPWAKPPDLGSDTPITSTAERLSEQGAKRARLLPIETTLVSCIGILGKVGLAGRTLATNQQINSVVFDQSLVLPKYGFHYCKTLKNWLDENSSSTTVAIVNKGRFSEAPFALSPLNEQGRIVAKLEEVLSRVDAAQARLVTIPLILKRFRQSLLDAACSGRLTADWREKNFKEESEDLPVGWIRMAIEELLPKNGIFDGPFGSHLKTSDYTPSGVRVIRLENIGHLNFIDEKETYVSEEKYETLTRHTVQKDDIIFASFIADEIRACVLPRLSTKAIAKADCFCLRPKSDLIDRTYLTYQLVSQESFNALIDNIHGATRPRINTTQLRKLIVRICSLAEQQEIVRRVEALFKTADALETRYFKAKKHVDKLTQSILAKAFRGELVPQDPNDEPASILLDRTRKEGRGSQIGKSPRKNLRSRRARHT